MSRPAGLVALAWVAGFTLIDSSIVSLALRSIARHFDRRDDSIKRASMILATVKFD